MITLENKQIMINGKATLLISGEIHYYRLSPSVWEERLDQLIAAGCNTVATYVPWVYHQEKEDELDLSGKFREELNLEAFIDLSHKKGLYFFLRPGPFIMAEMKNEGIPYWVIEKHPEIVPTTWDREVVTTCTLDYLAPAFLAETKQWYKALMKIVKPRLIHQGGNIIGIQLDNEVGMLSWVSNSPELTPLSISQFKAYLKSTYKDKVNERYPFIDKDFEQNVVSPKEPYATQIRLDLGYYHRQRYVTYIDTLRAYVEEFGVSGIPFAINIHGTSGGRALLYPIGLSQLFETYQKEGYWAGSDIYFSEMTLNNFHDLYIINAWMDALNLPNQPLASFEFGCGDGNYGDNLGERQSPATNDFRLRMCLAQGNRLINYYLFSGGKNALLRYPKGDGNNRIAITGEHHGFAAPVGPTGKLNVTYERIRQGNLAALANSSFLSKMNEELTGVYYGFIPDYFMTEYTYPKSQKMRQIVDNLQANRLGSAWEIIAKVALLKGIPFGGIDLQRKPLNPKVHRVIFFSSARYLDPVSQTRLVEYVREGGHLLITGELPLYDLEGNSCTLLVDALKIKVNETIYDHHRFELSIVPVGPFQGQPEIRTWYAQTYQLNHGTPLYEVVYNHAICAFESTLGAGKVAVFGTSLNANLELLEKLFESLEINGNLSHDFESLGVWMTLTTDQQQKLLHIINLDSFDKEGHIAYKGIPLFDGKLITLGAKEALMLPMDVEVQGIQILFSTAELVDNQPNSLTFRLTQPEDVIRFKTKHNVLIDGEDHLVHHKDTYTVYYQQGYHRNRHVTLRWTD